MNWNFKKLDKVTFELVEQENKNINKNKYTYIWEYDEIDPLILEIIKKGKDFDNDQKTIKIKKKTYYLKLISNKKLDFKTKELIDKNIYLQTLISDFKTKDIENQNQLNKLNNEIEILKIKAINDANKFKDEILNIQKKAQELINEHKSKTNDHQNEQIKEAKLYALQSFMEDLIQPLNNFEIAITAASKIDNDVLKNFIIGFNMLYKQIENVLKDFGLFKIEPKVGDIFDSNLHQVYEIVNSDLDKDTILEVKNIGYRLHDRTIKPALVIVAK
ncbi:nucleotide exchange factor GrpE [Metamycoplasma canadense]|uniref:Protein GrpE n=1 Tax=Metamycoplasma canadense TaxID=29554 RepID=A0A077L8R6_9BACT|nr:nucleotide exchange factor GrpE [Metamycoplasma canadense]BAP39428.1 grpE protein [Metamycoplasma canadense]